MGYDIKEARRGILTRETLIQSAASVTPGRFQEIGSYKVPAGIAVELGYGVHLALNEAVGRIWMRLMNNATPAAEIAGLVRLEIVDAQRRSLEIVFESRTEILSQGETNRSLQIPFPETGAIVTEDNIILLLLKPDTETGAVGLASSVLIDTTVYTARRPVEVR